MDKKFDEIFVLAKPYLKKGVMKDFVTHTKSVVQAMEMIINGEGGDRDILIPAAILHDVGFSKVSAELQTSGDLDKKREAQRQHLAFAKDIIKEILSKVGFESERINHIIEVVEAHKFQDPKEPEKRMLIDADNLSDTFMEQFYSDVIAYGKPESEVYEFRTRNEYYTNIAKKIAGKNMTELSKIIKAK